MKIFFYAGILFLALGLLLVFTSIGSEGILSGSIFGFGTIFFLIGAVLTIIASPVKKQNKKKEQGPEGQTTSMLLVSRTQLAVGVLVSATFFLVFFLVYPGTVLVGPFANHGKQNDYLNASYTGLKDQYMIGEQLEFSIEYEGDWIYDQYFGITINKLQNADGMDTDETVWFVANELEGFPLNDGGTPQHINKVVHVGGNESSSGALILEEAGLYSVVTEGRNIINSEKRFSVIDPVQNSSDKS